MNLLFGKICPFGNRQTQPMVAQFELHLLFGAGDWVSCPRGPNLDIGNLDLEHPCAPLPALKNTISQETHLKHGTEVAQNRQLIWHVVKREGAAFDSLM